MIVRLVYLDRFGYPFEIVNSIFRSGHQAVAEQVVHAVDVELRRYKLSERPGLTVAANDRRDIAGETGRVFLQQAAHLGLIAQNRFDRKLLVMKIEDRLNYMRKRPVPDVMKEGSDPNGSLSLIRNLIAEPQFRDHSRRQMKRPQAVRKPRMLRRLIGKIRQPKLPDPPQPLKFGRVDQPDD